MADASGKPAAEAKEEVKEAPKEVDLLTQVRFALNLCRCGETARLNAPMSPSRS